MADEENTPENEEDPWGDALAEQADGEAEAAAGSEEVSAVDALEAAGLSELVDSSQLPEDLGDGENVDLDMILDIPVTISMEIGRTTISIRNLLKLNQGSVVELDRLAGEPLDVLVNGTLIAHGEVVVVNEKFGIRLTDVITAMERVKKLT